MQESGPNKKKEYIYIYIEYIYNPVGCMYASESEKKNIMGRRVGCSGGGWRQGANIGARGGARAQIIGASVLLRSPETLNFFKKMYIIYKKRIIKFCCIKMYGERCRKHSLDSLLFRKTKCVVSMVSSTFTKVQCAEGTF